jgi:hypothetical protein
MAHSILLFILLILTSSCLVTPETFQSDKLPSVGYRYLDLIADETFDSVGEWRTYDGGENLYMNVEDGVYRINLSQRQIVWTQAPIQHDNAVIEATVTQGSDYNHNAFGIACRLSPSNNGRGYYFLISDDGYYTIRWNNGRSLDNIVPATPSSAIKTGQSNIIRAVCIDDYLALWINDEFVAEAYDKKSSNGVIGLSGVMNYDGRNLTVEFDDLKVWNAMLLSIEED